MASYPLFLSSILTGSTIFSSLVPIKLSLANKKKPKEQFSFFLPKELSVLELPTLHSLELTSHTDIIWPETRQILEIIIIQLAGYVITFIDFNTH